MNIKKIAFISISGMAVIILLVLFFIFSFNSPVKTPGNSATNPTVVPINETGQPLRLASSSPQNGNTNVPISTPIVLTFNNSLDNLTPSISLIPVVPFTFSSTQNVLTITPSAAFSPSTNYTVTVAISRQTFFTSFTSFGPTPTFAPSTRDASQIDQENLILKEQYPDAYLANKTPYGNSDFSVVSTLDNKTGKFVFTVTSKNSLPAAQTSFKAWAEQQGLTDTQISSLQVIYK